MKATRPLTSALRILGVMTGTSCDGLDAACAEFSSECPTGRLLWTQSHSYVRELRERVGEVQASNYRGSLQELLILNRDLGRYYANCLRKIIDRAPTHARPQVIANHGQTIAHFPDQRGGTTWQIGDPAILATRTGLTVVSEFRRGDQAAGGQGAPLVPLFHQHLIEKLSVRPGDFSLLNIGGIANLTYLSPDRRLICMDSGPGNLWMDQLTQEWTKDRIPYDRGGRFARMGQVDLKAMNEILKHPYFAKKPPKSTGRGDFPLAMLTNLSQTKVPSLIATALEITVETIARAYKAFIPRVHLLETIVVVGGGSKNSFLMERLQLRLPQIKIRVAEELGLESQYVEAQAFAYFGYRALHGQPLGGPWTGSRKFGPPAQLTPGENWPEVCQNIRFSGSTTHVNPGG